MGSATWLGTAGIQTALMLAVSFPLALIAAWTSRKRNWRLLLLVAALIALHDFLVALPRISYFQHLHWSWQEALLATAWPLALAVFTPPSFSLASFGITSPLTMGWLKPAIVALLLAFAVPVLFFFLGSRKKLDAEGWAYLLIMPGLAEELVFRGVFQSLLNRVFGRPWRFANAQFGWGLIITAVLFAGANGLFAIDAHLHPRVVVYAAIAPLMLSLVAGWVRERTDSVWPCVFGHNLSNMVIPVATLLLR
jgi:membrane protease YdiL (CAAX protease family)